MDEDLKRKNILDLQFQKFLIIASTSVVIALTFFVGVVIAVFTDQIKLNDYHRMISLAIISSGVLGICFIFFYSSVSHLRNIIEVLKKL